MRPIDDMRNLREKMRKEREDTMKKEAELKMLQHWKINNPRVRQAESSRNSLIVKKQLELQMAEKKEMEEKKRQDQEKMDKFMVEEDKRKRDELLRIEEDRKIKLQDMKKDLEKQMMELREREREMLVWKRARAEQEELQRRVEQCEDERKRVEQIRANREYGTYQKRQHRLKLKMKTKQIQEDLETDRKKTRGDGEAYKIAGRCASRKKEKSS